MTSFASLSEIQTPQPPLLFHHENLQSQQADSLFILHYMNRSASLVCVNTGEMSDLPEGGEVGVIVILLSL